MYNGSGGDGSVVLSIVMLILYTAPEFTVVRVTVSHLFAWSVMSVKLHSALISNLFLIWCQCIMLLLILIGS